MSTMYNNVLVYLIVVVRGMPKGVSEYSEYSEYAINRLYLIVVVRRVPKSV
jgi:hypothetical protein